MIIFKCFFKLRTPSGLSRLQDQYAQIRALVERRRADPWGLLVLSESLLNPTLVAPETQNPGHQINLSPFDHYWVPAACLVLVALCSTRQMNFRFLGFTFQGRWGREAVIVNQWFSNFCFHQNHLESLLKYSSLEPSPRMSDSVGIEGLRMCSSNKFLGDAKMASPGTTLKTTNANNQINKISSDNGKCYVFRK